MELSHLDEKGHARMVDVTGKDPTVREAAAGGEILMQPETLALIQSGGLPKGDVLAVARVAGIMAAKRTPELIPMCHPLPLTNVAVDFGFDDDRSAVLITGRARCTGVTGVEMEALTAVSVAALTIYDMCKAVDRGMKIGNIRLLRKTGGKSGNIILEQDAPQSGSSDGGQNPGFPSASSPHGSSSPSASSRQGTKGEIVAVCVSDEKGVPKTSVDEALLQVNWGIEGDAHAGKWHRQVSLLAIESIDKMRAKGLDVRPGSFAENVTTMGIELYTLPVGTRMRLGSALARVTQIGKVCHSRCAIYRQAGDCVMPREGIFVEILEGGTISAGDPVEVLGVVGAKTSDTAPTDAGAADGVGTVKAVSLSEKRGTSKHEVDYAELQADWGLIGDAHAGNWHRQVALLAWESIEKALERGLDVGPGSFAENITTHGLELPSLPIGTRLRVGPTLLEITQIGKDAHEHDVIHELVGDSVIPREGVFCRVLEGGVVKAGDAITVFRGREEG